MIFKSTKYLAVFLIGVTATTVSWARDDNAAPVTLITGARIFDGVSDTLIEGQDVLVRDGKIAKVGADIAAPHGARVIDAAGRVMSPGFTDVHYHLSLCSVPIMDMAGSGAPDLDYIGILAGQEAERVLMRGFTSVRDVGGASWGAKLAADRGLIAGPRVWPSLRTISQFGGTFTIEQPGARPVRR